MILHIPLRPEMESELRSCAAAAGKDVGSFGRDVIEVMLHTNKPTRVRTRKRRGLPERWIRELRGWAASHEPLPYEADDSRESIYEGRGE